MDSFHTPPHPHATSASDASPELQRVRDILFGEAHHDLLARLDALESRLTREVEAMRTAFDERADALHEAIEADRAQRDRERGDYDEHLRTLAESLRTTRDAAEARADALERALRQVMNEQAATLSQRLVRTEASLRDAKADRSLLADLLGQVADGLRHSPSPAPAEPVSLAALPVPDEANTTLHPELSDDAEPALPAPDPFEAR